MKMGAWSPLAVDRVRYVGDAVVIVVADTKGQARDAAEAVEVTYKERNGGHRRCQGARRLARRSFIRRRTTTSSSTGAWRCGSRRRGDRQGRACDAR